MAATETTYQLEFYAYQRIGFIPLDPRVDALCLAIRQALKGQQSRFVPAAIHAAIAAFNRQEIFCGEARHDAAVDVEVRHKPGETGVLVVSLETDDPQLRDELPEIYGTRIEFEIAAPTRQ